MITAHVRLFGSVHDVVGRTKDELQLPDDASVRDLLSVLCSRYGDAFTRRILTRNGKLQTYTRIFVDGTEIDYVNLDSQLIDAGFAEAESSVAVEVFVVQVAMGG